MKRKNLPKCMYFKHSQYWLVKKNKWHPLGKSYPHAMAEYARLVTLGECGNEVAKLVEETINEAEKDLAENTIKQYRLCVEKISFAFQDFKVSQVKAKHIHQFMQGHSDTPNMANRMLSVLRMSFHRAVILEMCEFNPCLSIRRLKEKKRTRLMLHGEFMAIRAYDNDALKSIMDLCYLTAQRVSDILKIKMNDIYKDGIYIEQKKTQKKVFIKMSPDMNKAIQRAKKLHLKHVTPIYLLGQRNGRIRGYSGVKDLFNRAKTKAGIKDLTLHDIRAMALTKADKMGLNAKALAGHSTEQQLNTYLRDKTAVVVEGVGSIK